LDDALRLLWPFVSSLLCAAVFPPSFFLAQTPLVQTFGIRAPRAGFNGTTPVNLFSTYNDGSLLATGLLGSGATPASGGGERMVWSASKAAFRAGSAGSSGATAWDEGSVGYYSAAFGYGVTVPGLGGFAAGYLSSCTGSYCTALGYRSHSGGTGSVAIGYRTTASGDYSVAIGQRASADGRAGAIVFADASTTDSLLASANNQFSVRAAGGYRLFTNATTTVGVTLSSGGGSWQTLSDRHRKQDIEAFDGEEVLARLPQVPVSMWRYTAQAEVAPDVRHVGPMAQDWQRAFGLSTDSTTINTGDIDGINLAAVHALALRTDALRADNALLSAEVDALRAALGATAARLDTATARLDDATARLTALEGLAAEVARLRTALDALLERTPTP